MFDVRYAAWAALAGGLIPVMAALNAKLGRSLGEPGHAAVVLFAVGLIAACAASLMLTGRLPAPSAVIAAPPLSLLGGTIVAFYVFSITLLAPRFGVGNAILFAVVAQVFTSAVIDHWGLFGAVVRPVSLIRMGGLAIIVTGLAVTQLGAKAA